MWHCNVIQEKTVFLLDREETLLNIKVNPNDPALYQMYWCADCERFVTLGALHPHEAVRHAGHRLAWLPGVDEVAPGFRLQHMAGWLERTPLTPERRSWLQTVAVQTDTLNWAWVLNETEQTDWFEYLDGFLDRLADDWLDALNRRNAWRVWQDETPPDMTFSWVTEATQG
jgi:hypothetical protein